MHTTVDHPRIIETARPGVLLRELFTPQDDVAYFAAVQASRKHLSQFGDVTSEKYKSLGDVTMARLTAGDKIRMGIWDQDTFTGSIRAVPSGNDSIEIGYWLDVRHTGHGYAKLAAHALATHVAERYQRVYAEIVPENLASRHVLLAAGFVPSGFSGEHEVFDFDATAAFAPRLRQP